MRLPGSRPRMRTQLRYARGLTRANFPLGRGISPACSVLRGDFAIERDQAVLRYLVLRLRGHVIRVLHLDQRVAATHEELARMVPERCDVRLVAHAAEVGVDLVLAPAVVAALEHGLHLLDTGALRHA